MDSKKSCDKWMIGRYLSTMIRASVLTFAVIFSFAALVSASRFSQRVAEHRSMVDEKWSRAAVSEPRNASIREQQASTASAADLKLSDAVSPARFRQDHGVIVPYASGYVAFWDDDRDGATAVYLQTLELNGNLTGSNQLFRFLTNGNAIGEPRAVRDGSGKIHLFVRDQSRGLIYGARLASDLSVEVASYLVNDSATSASAGLFDVAVYPDGRVVVVWEDYSLSGNWIRARSYSAVGVPGSIVQVSSAVTATQQWAPSVGIDPAGGYMIVWEDYRNAQADLYGRQYDAAGSPVGSDLTFVPGGPAASEQITPVVAFSSVHDFVIGWIDGRAGQQLYAQRFDAITGLVGVNTLINAASSSAAADDPAIVSLPNGSVVCGWASFAATNQILFTNMSALFAPQTEFPVNLGVTGQRWGGDIWPLDNSSFVSLWTEVNTDEDIHLQRISTSGVRAWTENQLNDDASGTTASNPAVAAFTTWNHLAVFADERNDGGDIFVQPFTSDGQKLGSNQRVSQDAIGVVQSLPAIAARPSGGIVTWRDDRAVNGVSGQRIFGRLVSDGGVLSNPEFLISDSLAVNGKSAQTVAMNRDGISVASWLELSGGSQRISARWISMLGNFIGPVQLLDTISTGSVVSIAAGADSLGLFHFAWAQVTGSGATLHGRRFTAGQAFQNSFSYQLPGGSATEEVAVAFQPDGGAVAVWTETQGTGLILKIVGLNPSGIVRFGPITIVGTAANLPREISISSDEAGRISLCWIDNRSGSPQVIATQLNANLTTLVTEYAVATSAPGFMRAPAVSARFGRSHIVWLDPRGDGLEVFAATTLFDATDANEDTPPSLPGSFAIRSVYPNPFNPSTTISFSLAVRGQVRLSIHNTLGQEVAVLHDAPLAAGEHTIEWNAASANGSPLASGAYFISLQVGNERTSKSVILLK